MSDPLLHYFGRVILYKVPISLASSTESLIKVIDHRLKIIDDQGVVDPHFETNKRENEANKAKVKQFLGEKTPQIQLNFFEIRDLKEPLIFSENFEIRISTDAVFLFNQGLWTVNHLIFIEVGITVFKLILW